MGPERREGACERSEQADDRSEGHPAGRRYPSVRQKADLFCKANLPDRGVPRPAVQPTDTTKPGNTKKNQVLSHVLIRKYCFKTKTNYQSDV